MVNGKLLYTNTNLDTWKKYTISTPKVKMHTLIKALMVNTRKPKREKKPSGDATNEPLTIHINNRKIVLL